MLKRRLIAAIAVLGFAFIWSTQVGTVASAMAHLPSVGDCCCPHADEAPASTSIDAACCCDARQPAPRVTPLDSFNLTDQEPQVGIDVVSPTIDLKTPVTRHLRPAVVDRPPDPGVRTFLKHQSLLL